MLARLVGVPRPLASVLGLGAFVVLIFAHPTLAWRPVPTTETAELLAGVLRQGLLEVEELAAPVPSTPGLVLLAEAVQFRPPSGSSNGRKLATRVTLPASSGLAKA